MKADGHQEGSLPTFEEYSVEVFAGSRPKLWLSDDERYFEADYRQAHSEAVNFAGHYVLRNAQYGCCPSLLTTIGVDVKTGKAATIDFEGMSDPEDKFGGRGDLDCPPEFEGPDGKSIRSGFEYKPNSRLLKVSGILSDKRCQIVYYEMADGQLRQIMRYYPDETQ